MVENRLIKYLKKLGKGLQCTQKSKRKKNNTGLKQKMNT